MDSVEELKDVAERLKAEAAIFKRPKIGKPIESLEKAAAAVDKSFSGSWLGYHSRVYYENFSSPRPGHHFSQIVGLNDDGWSDNRTKGPWAEQLGDNVKAVVRAQAGNPNLSDADDAALKAEAQFEEGKSVIASIIESHLRSRPDAVLAHLKGKLSSLGPISAVDLIRTRAPKGQLISSDMVALSQGVEAPPHLELLSQAQAIRFTFDLCKEAAAIALKAADHLARLDRTHKRNNVAVGTNIFIGHGQSPAWRELKDFISDRLDLPYDEFNRVPVAGVTNTARLAEMMNDAALALLVMTAEDELADGGLQARTNVVHEAGLFQGRLGFTKAIVLIEEGCREFSNIQGLGQIRFPKNRISACFEEVRRVLEREGLIEE